MVECTIQTVKRTIKKCWIMNEDVHLALLILRSTNKKGYEKSPGEILMKRTLRTTLPSVKTFRSGSFEESKTLKQNSGCRALKPLKVGDRVRTHNGKTWSQTGTVERIDNNPCSYLIKRDDGVKIRWNRVHLLIIPNAAVTPYQDLDETAIKGEECVELSSHEENSSNQQTTQNVTPPPVITRSGRVGCKPSYLRNYET